MSNNSIIKILAISVILFIWGTKEIFCQGVSETQWSEPIEVIGVEETKSGLVDAPVKVEVMTEEYLKEQQYQDVAESLGDIPGVTTQATERRAGSKSALIQGFGENSVLVMIDGVPVSQNSSFGFDLSQMATSNVERVEVIKGGASALYGSQAMGGVINIVTKRVSSKPKIELEASGGQLAGGENGQARNLKGHLEGGLGKLRAKATFAQREQDSFDLNSDTISRDGAEFTKQQGNLRLAFPIGTMTVFVDGLFLKGDTLSLTSKPYSSNSFGPTQNKTETETLNTKLGFEGKLGSGTLRAILNYEMNKDRLSLNDNPETPFIETIKNTEFVGRRADLQYKDIKVGDHSISTGLLVRENTVDQNTINQSVVDIITETRDIEGKKISSYETFVQDNFWVGNFEVSPGARYQYDRDFGSFVSPKINLSHFTDIGDWGLKTWATVGTGYRAPSVKERFFTLDHTSVANYIVTGNENLAPEKSLSFQLGEEIKTKFKGREFSIYGNLFLNKISNLIEITEGEGDGVGTVFTYQNFQEVYSRGIELGLKSAISQKLSFRLNGSYTETVDETTNLLIANRPLLMGMASFNYDFSEKLHVISMTRFMGASFTDVENETVSPEFTTTDLKLNYRHSERISAFLNLKNILDSTRDPNADTVLPVIDSRPSRGREIFLGLNMRVL
jgi:outer membrane receptor for ferrienterochelin and colicins